MNAPSLDNCFLADHAELLIGSYRRLTGRHLIMPEADRAAMYRALYEADFAVVSHGTQADPLFNYANLAAQRIFELDWSGFMRLPSRESAEPVNQEARARLMARVRQDGYIDDYSGVRISATGKRFTISNATIWNLVDKTGEYRGQAAMFTL